MRFFSELFFVLLLALSVSCKPQPTVSSSFAFEQGAIVRGDTTKKCLSVVFTAHEFAEGYEVLRSTLKKHDVKGAFFLTGDFYRNPHFAYIVNGLKEDGHYLGAHSDKHLLYCPWEKRDSLLVSKDEFWADIEGNYAEMAKFGIKKLDAPYYLPPYEWYNDSISSWTDQLGLQLINYTGGTASNADYTTPDMPRYYSSDTIFNRILRFEQDKANGLNGFLLLTHLGAGDKRSDKFYNRMDELLDSLKQRGYTIVPIQQLLAK